MSVNGCVVICVVVCDGCGGGGCVVFCSGGGGGFVVVFCGGGGGGGCGGGCGGVFVGVCCVPVLPSLIKPSFNLFLL